MGSNGGADPDLPECPVLAFLELAMLVSMLTGAGGGLAGETNRRFSAPAKALGFTEEIFSALEVRDATFYTHATNATN